MARRESIWLRELGNVKRAVHPPVWVGGGFPSITSISAAPKLGRVNTYSHTFYVWHFSSMRGSGPSLCFWKA